MKFIFPYSFVVFLFFSACSNNSGQNSGSADSQAPKDGVVSAEQFSKLLKNASSQLVDVRTPEEFNEGHIEKAVNHNFYDDDFLQNFADFDKNKPLLIYCRSGGRSGKAYKLLKKEGFSVIYDLEGGYSKWPHK